MVAWPMSMYKVLSGLKQGNVQWYRRQIMYKISDIFTLEKDQQ